MDGSDLTWNHLTVTLCLGVRLGLSKQPFPAYLENPT